MTDFKAFLAGLFSTLLFHQGLIALFGRFQEIPFHAYDWTETWPLGVPNFLSLSFFAGLWAVLIWRLIHRQPRLRQFVFATILGAVLPTAVAFAVVLPLKGIEMKWIFLPFGLLLNGIWGAGMWILMFAMEFLKTKKNHSPSSSF